MTTVTPISSLTALTSGADTDVLPIVDDSASATKKITLANLRAALISGAATTISTADLTALYALISNASGKVAIGGATSTELGYLSGVTSALQTQINALTQAESAVKNLLVNGNFDRWDKGTSFTNATTPANNNDTYLLPAWNLLSDGNDRTNVSQQTASPQPGSRYFLRHTAQATNQFGLVQFIEAQDAIPLRGKVVSLSFQAKASSTFNARAAILSWTGTADTLTSDVVSAWAATPTFAASWTAENTPGDLALTTGWQTFKVENVTIATSGMNNLAVFIWVNSPSAAATFDFSQVQLELNTVASTFIPRPVENEIILCKRRYLRMGGDASANGPALYGMVNASTDKYKNWIQFPTEMRIAPTGTVAGTWAVTNCTGPTLENISTQGFALTCTGNNGNARVTCETNGTDDYIEFDAEL